MPVDEYWNFSRLLGPVVIFQDRFPTTGPVLTRTESGVLQESRQSPHGGEDLIVIVRRLLTVVVVREPWSDLRPCRPYEHVGTVRLGPYVGSNSLVV